LATKYDMATKWKQFKLLDIASISENRVSEFSGEKDYIATGDLDFITISGGTATTYAHRPSRADLIINDSEVLFAKMKGTVKVLIGSKEVKDKIFSTGFYILKPQDDVSKEFLYFYFLSDYFNQQKDLYCTGATMSALTNEGLKKILVSLPVDKNGNHDLAEQKRIVSMLEEAETLKKKRAEADQKMDEVIPALFSKMFSGSKFDDPKLGTSITNLTSGARGWAKYYTSTPGYKYIRIQNVKNAKLNFNDVQYVEVLDSAESKRIKVQEGDLLISITADLGRTAVVDKETANDGAYINQHIALVRLNNEYNPLFVAHYLENGGKNQFLKYGQAASKKGLNFDSVRSLRIPKPPIELQNDFVDKVKEIEVQKEKQKQSAVQLDVLFSSLLSRAFSTKIPR